MIPPRVNQLIVDSKFEPNDSNNLSQQIQLFNHERTDENDEELIEAKLEKILPKDAENLIREYEEEMKNQLDSNGDDKAIMFNKFNLNTLSPMMKKNHLMLSRMRASQDESQNSFLASPMNNDNYFTKNSKLVIGKFLSLSNINSETENIDSEGNEIKGENMSLEKEEMESMQLKYLNIHNKESNASLMRPSLDDFS